MLKALVVNDEKRKITDLGDLLAIARAIGQTAFHTKENVRVLPQHVFYLANLNCYIVVVEFPERSKPAGVSGLETKQA
mgnify:CR=1 FL=1